MNRYWDLTERQRSELSADQVSAMLAVELMEKGVVKVTPPKLRDLANPELPKDDFFTVEGCGGRYNTHKFDAIFDTVEQAQAFIATNPKASNYNYDIGEKYTYVEPITGYKIVPVKYCRKHDTVNLKNQLTKLKADEEANRKEMDAYDIACKKVQEATDGMWNDWHECRAVAEANRQIVSVFEEYVKTCDGNTAMAARFLAKAFPAHKIDEAFEWFGMRGPSPIEAACAPVAAE